MTTAAREDVERALAARGVAVEGTCSRGLLRYSGVYVEGVLGTTLGSWGYEVLAGPEATVPLATGQLAPNATAEQVAAEFHQAVLEAQRAVAQELGLRAEDER